MKAAMGRIRDRLADFLGWTLPLNVLVAILIAIWADSLVLKICGTVAALAFTHLFLLLKKLNHVQSNLVDEYSSLSEEQRQDLLEAWRRVHGAEGADQ